MTISYELCWNIDSRKIIWPPRAHFGSENESLKGLIMSYQRCTCEEEYLVYIGLLRVDLTDINDDFFVKKIIGIIALGVE